MLRARTGFIVAYTLLVIDLLHGGNAHTVSLLSLKFFEPVRSITEVVNAQAQLAVAILIFITWEGRATSGLSSFQDRTSLRL